jgi:hypothetical protein
VTESCIKCIKCKGQLSPSGVEVHRYICQDCGQNYHAVLHFVPVESIHRAKELLGSGDANGNSAPDGGSKIP